MAMSLNLWWVLFAAAVLIFWPFLQYHRHSGRQSTACSGDYQPKQLLTPNEIEFYGRITRALPDDAVFVQVAMSALLKTTISEQAPEFWAARSKFSQKYIDYVVCDRKSLTVIAIIELDDKTHDHVKDAERDKMLAQAGYAVLRWKSVNKPRTDVIAAEVNRCRPHRKA